MNADIHDAGAPASAGQRADVHLQHAVEQFLYDEAAHLDNHRYHDWLEHFGEDVRYWAPTRMTRTYRERDIEISASDEGSFIDDDFHFLQGRVRRLTSGMSWSEEPPSRTRRLLNNIRVSHREDGDLDVACNFYVYRSRLERHQDWFVGERFDVLRHHTGTVPFKVRERRIVLDQTTILAPSISIFL